MAVTVEGYGTQACTVGTEHSLAVVSTAKTFVATLDFSNAQNGDEFEVRTKVQVVPAGSRKQAEYAPIVNAQDDVVIMTPPTASPYSWEVTVKQTAGTGRNVDWNVVSV